MVSHQVEVEMVVAIGLEEPVETEMVVAMAVEEVLEVGQEGKEVGMVAASVEEVEEVAGALEVIHQCHLVLAVLEKDYGSRHGTTHRLLLDGAFAPALELRSRAGCFVWLDDS